MSEKEAEATTHVGRVKTSYPPPPSQYPPSPSSHTIPDPVMSTPSAPPLPPTLRDTTYWRITSTTVKNSRRIVPQGVVTPPPKAKSLLEAYLLCLPLGFLGAHHFYLGRPLFGVMYFLTLGLAGFGWLIDIIRMPCLVSQVNKANRERHEQLQSLQDTLTQQRLQLVQQYGPVAAQQMTQNVGFVPFEPRNLVDAYILWFPFGIFGYHHFYLRNYTMGIVYHITFGLMGVGWLVDLFRMPSLVREANSRKRRHEYSQCTAHLFAISPAGILGGHHFYLNRPVWGCLYFFTLGVLGTGWVYDWFRTSCLVKRANAISQGLKSPKLKYMDDAYFLCLTLGYLGLHHFYLRRYGWGALYFLTLGIFGLGWLVDWFRLPCLVRDHNANCDLTEPLISASSASSSAGGGDGGGFVNGDVGNQFQASNGALTTYPPVGGYPGCYQGAYPGPVAYDGTYPSHTAPAHSLVGDSGPGVMYPPPQYSASSLPHFNASVPPPSEHGLAPPSYDDAMHDQNMENKE